MDFFLTAAEQYAQLGYYVFQCKPNGKEPYYPTAPHGCKDATDDIDTIRRWWNKFPRCNIGICCRNCLVLDIDVKTVNGMDKLQEIAEELGSFPRPFRVSTPSGGVHYYFKSPTGVSVSGRTHLLFNDEETGIDVRVGNQYVVAPPSVLAIGKYELTEATAFSPVSQLPELPQSWIDFLPKKQSPENAPKPLAKRALNLAPDTDVAQRCRKYVAAMPAAISGQGGHSALFAVVRTIFYRFNLPEEIGRAILDEYNARCQPEWSQRDLEHKIQQLEQVSSSTQRGDLAASGSDTEEDEHQPDFAWFNRLWENKFGTAEDDTAEDDEEEETEETEDLEETEDTEDIENSDDVFPPQLLNVPGFISQFTAYVNNASFMYQPVLSLAGGLAFLGLLAGPTYMDPTGNRCNIQIIALAESGDGKDDVRKAIKNIVAKLKTSLVIESVASYQGALKALSRDNSLLWLWDEMGAVIKSTQNENAPHLAGILPLLMKLYTSANTTFYPDVKSGMDETKALVRPNMVLYGTSIPKNVLEGISENQLIDGFLGRVHLFEGRRPEEYPFEVKPIPEIPDKLMHICRALFNLSYGMSKNQVVVEITDEAKAVLHTLHDKAAEKRKGENRIAAALWARVRQQAQQLALLYAVSASCDEELTEPLIDAPAMEWACELAEYLVKRKETLAYLYVSDGDFGKKQNAVLRYIAAAGKSGRTKTDLNHRFRTWRLKDREEVLINLLATQQIAAQQKKTGKRKANIYTARQHYYF